MNEYKYIMPYLIKSKINVVNTEFNNTIQPKDVCYDHMDLKEFTKNEINRLWDIIVKDISTFNKLGQSIISYYPNTNKDKILKVYFISNKYKILEVYNKFDELFNKILNLIDDYNRTVYLSRYLYKCRNYSF